MSTAVRWILTSFGLLLLVAVLIAALFWGMRYHDGPLEIIRGGPFKSGAPYDGPEPDWSFLKDRMVIEFQTMEPPTSRVIWLAVENNRLYLISSFMNTGYGKVWKRWPRSVEKDNRAIMRVDGKLYKRRLHRLDGSKLTEGVIREFKRKYDLDISAENIESGSTWLFELAPAEPSA